MTKTSIQQLRENFSYDPFTGVLTRIKDVGGKYRIGDPVGSENFERYLTVYVQQEKLLAHRIAWAMFYGEWPTESLDHINMNRADNRIENLRIASHAQNQHNTRPRSNSGLKGVTRLPRGKYQAQIKVNGRQTYLGLFTTADEAAHAYNKMAIKHFGNFAVLNPVGS